MAVNVGSLLVSLGLDSGAFKSGLSQAEKAFKQTQRNFQKLGQNMTAIGGKMTLAISAPLTALGVQSVKAAIESRDALGQVEAALKSMGDGAGRTAEQLKGLAETGMRQSLYDDDEILRKVTANLLTFGNISGEAFDRAQQAAINLSARMGTDLQSSAIMVGKALNDPIKGMAALGRAGIQFTAAQKEQIKSMIEVGNAAGAQAIMLGELERQFGGAAKAAREADPMAATRQSWAEFQETLGEKILPLLPTITSALTSMIDAFGKLSPGMQKAVVIGGVLAATLGPVLIVFGSLVSTFGTLLPLLIKLGPAFAALRVAALALMANPVILAFSAVILGIYLAWKNWDKIEPILRNLYNGVKRWVLDGLNAIWRKVTAGVEVVKKAFFNLYDAVVGNSYIPDMVDGIAAHMKRLDSAMVDQAGKVTEATAEKFRNLRTILDRLFPEQRATLDFRADLAALKEQLTGGELDEAVKRLNREFAGVPLIGSGLDNPTVDMSAGELGTEGAARFEETWSRAVDAITEKVAGLKDRWGEFREAAAHAYEELTYQLKGVLLGAQSLGDALRNLVARLADMALTKAFQALGTAIGIPAFAGGTNYAPGGLALVGERGPELVNLPRGSQVIPNHELRGMSGGQTVHSPTFVFPGISNERQAREAGSQAALRYRQMLNGPVRA